MTMLANRLLNLLLICTSLIVVCNCNIIDCTGTETCYSQAKICDAGQDCTINCVGLRACDYASLEAGSATSLAIVCSGDSTCLDADIDCRSTATACSIDCSSSGGSEQCKLNSLHCGISACTINCGSSSANCDGCPNPQGGTSFKCIGSGCPNNLKNSEFTAEPTPQPTLQQPTPLPTNQPTNLPTKTPTYQPTSQPTPLPTNQPTNLPTETPTYQPTSNTLTPTLIPTKTPIYQPIPNTSTYKPIIIPTDLSISTLHTNFENSKMKSNRLAVEVWVVVVIAVIMFSLIIVYLSVAWRSNRRKNQRNRVDMDKELKDAQNTKSIELIDKELIVNDDVITPQFDNKDEFVVHGDDSDDDEIKTPKSPDNRQNNMKQKAYLNTAGNKKMNEVELWLINNCKLPKYYTIFMLNGYDSLDKIKSIQSKSQLANIGITLLGHQSKILEQIKHGVEQNSPDNDITTKFDDLKDKITIEGATGNGLEQDDFVVIGDKTATNM